jgi:putative ABC transport system permease protein
VHDLLTRDLRHAAKTLGRSPGFSAAVILTLALGIGASTAIFSVVYGALFRPLPFRDADRLVVIRMERAVEGASRPVTTLFPLADLARLQSGGHGFESVAFYSASSSVLSHGGFTHKVEAASVSDAFFPTVGGRIGSGRGLGRGADDGGAAVISERLRQRLFGSEDPLGRQLNIGARSYEIVGVAHRSFQLPSQDTDVWLPATDEKCCPYAAVARLKPGVSRLIATAQADGKIAALNAENPRTYAGATAKVMALRDELIGDVRTALWVLFGAVGLLLGVACANAATLLLARNAARAREAAVRIALGASRSRLIAESLAEAALTATVAGAIGLVIGAALIDGLTSLSPAGIPRLGAGSFRIDLPVFVFALSIAAGTAVVQGFLPAVRWERLVETVRIGAAGATAPPNRRRLHNGLVVLQLAISLVLLVSASLIGRSLVRLMKTDIGVQTDRVATAAINLSYERQADDSTQLALVDGLVERIGLLPDVRAAGVGASLPPNASTIRLTLKRAGDTVDYQATAVPATPGYFSALGIRLLQGRLFDADDSIGRQEVMIMSADTARRFFDVQNPIGRTLSLPVLRNGVATSADITLVGVIANVKYSGLQAAPDDAVYRPLRQQPWPTLFLVARTSGHPGVLASSLRREIAAVDPAIAVSSVSTLDEIVAGEAAQPRFRAALLAAIAAFSLAIAAVGLYGIVAHGVAQRTREFGIRIALGASRSNLLTLVMSEGARLVAGGVVAGLAGSLAATRILTGLLYGIEPTDAVSFAFAAALLLLVAVVAMFVPARRASHLNPITALRAE